MPDPTRATISATEAPALFNASPWCTRWMLYHAFRNNVNLDIEADDRMSEGLRMQPLILERAARELRLQVVPNSDDSYVRRGRLGCTRDAIVLHPEKGPGALEVKAVFDYAQWKTKWGGGDAIPRDYEIQLQQQMHVGDESGSYTWGIIVAWCGGQHFYFEREPHGKLISELIVEADRFFDDVELGNEPEPFGAPVEIPWLMKLYPTDETKIVNLRESSLGVRLSRQGRQYNESKRTARDHTKVAEVLRSEMVARLKGAGTILLPDGMSIRMGKRNRLTVFVPDEPEEVEANDN
jgi:predicted phage-related endonuclease